MKVSSKRYNERLRKITKPLRYNNYSLTKIRALAIQTNNFDNSLYSVDSSLLFTERNIYFKFCKQGVRGNIWSQAAVSV